MTSDLPKKLESIEVSSSTKANPNFQKMPNNSLRFIGKPLPLLFNKHRKSHTLLQQKHSKRRGKSHESSHPPYIASSPQAHCLRIPSEPRLRLPKLPGTISPNTRISPKQATSNRFLSFLPRCTLVSDRHTAPSAHRTSQWSPHRPPERASDSSAEPSA